MPELHIVTGLIRRGDELLMVRQAGRGEEPAWTVEVAPDDPDGFVSEAAFVPLGEAIELLSGIAWHPLTVSYLCSELPRGSLWLRRVHADGREDVTGPY